MKGRIEQTVANKRHIGYHIILDNGERSQTFSLYTNAVAWASAYEVELVKF